ncbi:MAG: hypothetical protein ABR591_00865 [Candidatus Velthaea sp.]
MRQNNHRSLVVFAAAAAVFVPLAARSAEPPATSSAITVSATPAVGREAVMIAGNAPAGTSLEAALYARFSQDVPNVLLSRRPVATDANGHYAATVPIASGFFRNAVVTVVINSVPAGASARTSFVVGAPNLPAPPDDIPSSVR